MNSPLVLFGGSFDPVHSAHLEAGLAASKALNSAKVFFMPNARSPLKQHTGASSTQRIAMLELALAPFSVLKLEDYEINRPPPSYMRDTLQHFRQQDDKRPLVLVIGADSLASLDQWADWQLFPVLCHLLVLPRPGANKPKDHILAAFAKAGSESLLTRPAGCRLMLTSPCIDLSSSDIRQQLAGDNMPASLPPGVDDYIQAQGLYRPKSVT